MVRMLTGTQGISVTMVRMLTDTQRISVNMIRMLKVHRL